MAKRNEGKHTDSSQAKSRILMALLNYNGQRGLKKSRLGYAAFPDYKFSRAQGAAFSVAKICRELESSGLIDYQSSDSDSGYIITAKGRSEISTIDYVKTALLNHPGRGEHPWQRFRGIRGGSIKVDEFRGRR